MHKKAKLLSVWWFFVITIIAVGIVIAVSMFYSQDTDVRQSEADILAQKILNCLNQQGYLHENFQKNDFDIFKECRLSKEVFHAEESIFYFKMSVRDENGNLIGKEIIGGKGSEKDCEISFAQQLEKLKAEYYPRCTDKKENVIYYDNTGKKIGKINILTASNQAGKRGVL